MTLTFQAVGSLAPALRQKNELTLVKRGELRSLIQNEPPIEKGNVYSAYLASIVSELVRRGLPVQASGVHLIIAGEGAGLAESMPLHMRLMALNFAGASGLAKGATIDGLKTELRKPNNQSEFWPLHAQGVEAMSSVVKNTIVGDLEERAEVMQRLVTHAQQTNPGHTTLVNISSGTNAFDLANEMARHVLGSEPGSRLTADLTKMLKHAPAPDDAQRIADALTPAIFEAIAKAAPEIERATRALEAEVAAARAAKVLVFQASGNEQMQANAWEAPDSAKIFQDVRGVVSVGAIDLGTDGRSMKDDHVAEFSVIGPVLGAAGVRIPLGGYNATGTSQSAPFVASVAALMLKANPSLGPDQIEQILKDTAKPVKGGLNQVDVIEAVARAAKQAGPVPAAGWQSGATSTGSTWKPPR